MVSRLKYIVTNRARPPSTAGLGYGTSQNYCCSCNVWCPTSRWLIRRVIVCNLWTTNRAVEGRRVCWLTQMFPSTESLLDIWIGFWIIAINKTTNHKFMILIFTDEHHFCDFWIILQEVKIQCKAVNRRHCGVQLKYHTTKCLTTQLFYMFAVNFSIYRLWS